MSVSWKGKCVAVVGLARSGVAACLFLRRRGARVTGVDLKPEAGLGPVLATLRDAGVDLSLGNYPDLSAFDAIVISPGVDPAQPSIARAKDKGVLLLPELELGALEARGRIACITGTKGKSTTTASLAAMLRAASMDARAVGNIGEPITAHIDASDEGTVFVTEASSFQLETTRDFRPGLAVFLNLFPDHLDRHPSFEAYAAAKGRIFANQTPEDLAVVNAEDARVLALASHTKARVIPFRPETPHEGPGTQSGFEAGRAVLRESSSAKAAIVFFSDGDIQVPGGAVRTNLLAAATAAHLMSASTEAIRDAVRAFRGVPHTFEKVGEIRGVAFFNDSKATTLDSVRVALLSFDTPVIAIMGGRLKAGSFDSLKDAVARGVRAVYAIGESSALVRDAFASICPVHEATTLEDAVTRAYHEAKPGDTILLSPGCSSFDMFRDYAHRGQTFKDTFRMLEGAA